MSLVAAGRLTSAGGAMRNALKRLPVFPGNRTADQNGLFELAMYHCLATSNTETDSYTSNHVNPAESRTKDYHPPVRRRRPAKHMLSVRAHRP